MTSRRPREIWSALQLAMLLSHLHPSHARAEWSVEPVQVRATSAICPLVAVASDGRGGAIVVWQEGTAPAGVLRAEHLDANGDVGAWAHAPATFGSADTPRRALGAVSDNLGGAYVWWMEASRLYLTRLTPDGFIAEGWTYRGNLLGNLLSAEHRPLVKPDGQGGVYAGWLSASTFAPRMASFGPDGRASRGWTASGRTLDLRQDLSFVTRAFAYEPAEDGGLWVSAQASPAVTSPYPSSSTGMLTVQRLEPSGLPAPGWETGARGVVFLEPESTWPVENTSSGNLALASDGKGGLFVASVNSGPWVDGPLFSRLLRLGPDGEPPAGWSYGGIKVGVRLQPASLNASADASVLAMSSTGGLVHVGVPDFPEEGNPKMVIRSYTATGELLDFGLLLDQGPIETALREDGGLFVASCKRAGSSPGSPGPARIGVWQMPTGTSFIEKYDDTPDSFYDDVGLASTGHGGAILAWGQHRVRQGVFAVRVDHDGLVTKIPPVPAPAAFRVRFTLGSGVQVTGATGPVTLSLHDLTGRQVAHGESPGSAEWTVPGTAGLPSGMYFAKAIADGSEKRAKVIVIR